MIRGLYTAAAGMIAEQRKHDTVTNNIANLQTAGYKQVNAISRSFPEMLIALSGGQASGGTSRQIGRLNTGVLAEEDPSLYVQGDLKETSNKFDFAIASNIESPNLEFNGTGMAFDADGNRVFQRQLFFTVQSPEGETRYSRSGNFEVNAAGELMTAEGYRVLGLDGQPIVLVDAAGRAIPEVKATEDGRFLNAVTGEPLRNAAGQQMGLLLSVVEDPNRLVREGNSVYRVNAGEEGTVTALADNAGVRNAEFGNWVDTHQAAIRQGYLEQSNVDPAQSMVELNNALRAYEANQKMVQYYDRSLEKAVNEVGRV
ncbi:flagellar hook-basal body protein [Gorillibacterium sp. CAU 1737]|uniref:flagellar hook-basal body protein n=1 Tax=Gorillibacterium sp. CAU 1737 TaxID=3140362 RepID=UPI003260FDA5